jgi:hypothetical protein
LTKGIQLHTGSDGLVDDSLAEDTLLEVEGGNEVVPLLSQEGLSPVE